MNILFPADTFEEKKIDSDLRDQFDSAITNGFGVGIVDLSRNTVREITDIQPGEKWVYRGWMMNLDKYTKFFSDLKSAGINLTASPSEYISNHHISGWIDKLSGLTPRTFLYKDRNEMDANWGKIPFKSYFVKDYVKSLKTKRGSIALNNEQAKEILNEIEKYRGELEGGIAIRECIDFIPSSERRYFIFNSQPVNRVLVEDGLLVGEVKNRIGGRSFYSVDVINDTNGNSWIVEIGDGQVSDLVEIDVDEFYKNLKNTA